MIRTPLVVLLLAAGVTTLGAAEPAQKPAPKKKPAVAAGSAPAAHKTPAPEAEDKEAEPQADVKPKDDPNLGMSILGNQEAPKALVIVPWKSSQIGQGTGIQTLLDDSRLPIDKDVFMRVLNYYELRSTTTPTTTQKNGTKGGKS